jgi:hypothetical protein
LKAGESRGTIPGIETIRPGVRSAFATNVSWKIKLAGVDMNPKVAMSFALIVGLLAFCGPTFAHHGNVAYDEIHTITVSGTVTEIVWANPHVQIFLDVRDDKGKVVNWGIESQSPGILHRNGWNKTSLKPGDQITITLAPSKNGAPVGFSGGNTGKVVFADGRVLRMNER